MKFAHKVKHNGKLYMPGEEVPIGTEAVIQEEDKETVQQVGTSGGIKTQDIPEERADVLGKWTNRELQEELTKHGITTKPNETKANLVQMLLDAEEQKVKDVVQKVEEVETHEEETPETGGDESGGFVESLLSE